MNLKTAKARMALIEQEAAILRDYIARMEKLGGQPEGQPFSALPVRARNALLLLCNPDVNRARDMVEPTPEQVSDLSKGDLLRYPNIGRVSLADIEAWLASHGLELRR